MMPFIRLEMILYSISDEISVWFCFLFVAQWFVHFFRKSSHVLTTYEACATYTRIMIFIPKLGECYYFFWLDSFFQGVTNKQKRDPPITLTQNSKQFSDFLEIILEKKFETFYHKQILQNLLGNIYSQKTIFFSVEKLLKKSFRHCFLVWINVTRWPSFWRFCPITQCAPSFPPIRLKICLWHPEKMFLINRNY